LLEDFLLVLVLGLGVVKASSSLRLVGSTTCVPLPELIKKFALSVVVLLSPRLLDVLPHYLEL
jgi:hypothetical protein